MIHYYYSSHFDNVEGFQEILLFGLLWQDLEYPVLQSV